MKYLFYIFLMFDLWLSFDSKEDPFFGNVDLILNGANDSFDDVDKALDKDNVKDKDIIDRNAPWCLTEFDESVVPVKGRIG